MNLEMSPENDSFVTVPMCTDKRKYTSPYFFNRWSLTWNNEHEFNHSHDNILSAELPLLVYGIFICSFVHQMNQVLPFGPKWQ